MASVDSTVTAPKLPATLLLHELSKKTRKRYRTSINGISIKGLSHYSVICLQQELMPVATLHAGFAVQVVGTRQEYLYPVVYNQNEISNSFRSNFSLIHGSPPQRTPLPPLTSLMSFSPEVPSPLLHDVAADSGFLALCVHIPLLSVGFSINQSLKLNTGSENQGWTGLLRRNRSKTVVYQNGHTSEDELGNRHLQLSIGKFDFEIFRTAESDAICTSFSVGRIAFKDAAGNNLLMSTALIRRYFNSSRVPAIVNFNPLRGFPRLMKIANPANRFLSHTSINQIAGSLLLSSKRVRGGIDFRYSRLEISIDSLQLIDSCLRALLKSMKDVKALGVAFPALQFKSSEYSSAQVSYGLPQFGFGVIVHATDSELQCRQPSCEQSTGGVLHARSPPPSFVPHIPDVLRKIGPLDLRNAEYFEPPTMRDKFPADLKHPHRRRNIQDQQLLRNQTIPNVFQLILFSYDLPARFHFEDAREFEWTDDSDKESSIGNHIVPLSVFEHAPHPKSLKSEKMPPRVEAFHKRTQMEPPRRVNEWNETSSLTERDILM